MQEDTASPASSSCAVCCHPARLQCLICLKRGLRPAPTFCGPHCYREHWKSHRKCSLDASSPSSSPELKPPTPEAQLSLPVFTSAPSTMPMLSLADIKPPQAQVPTGLHARHGSRSSVGWNTFRQASPGTCHPTQWYQDKWGAQGMLPGMAPFSRALPQEQVGGPTAGWGATGPSHWGDPQYKYWGTY